MSTNLVKGMALEITLADGTTHTGLFQDLVIIAQVMPAMVLEIRIAQKYTTVLFPVGNITSIILPKSSVLQPNLSETQEAQFSKL